MAAATPDYSLSRQSSHARSPDMVSPIFPERAIRPLPKNRLRSKLSPEQVGSIVYPPEPAISSPLFSFPYTAEQDTAVRQVNGHHHLPEVHNHCTCDHSHGPDSEDEEVEFDHPDYRYATSAPPRVPNGGPKAIDTVQRRLLEAARIPSKPPPPGSTASSADGYESFENTSNKKKRKIPLSASSSVHQSQLSAEMASMGIGGGDAALDDNTGMNGQHAYNPVPTSSGTGISGAGRGRYGKHSIRSERRPLGSSTMNALNGYSSRAPPRAGEVKNSDVQSKPAADQGIISAAIANAQQEGPITPSKGKENVSLLQQQSAKSTTPKTQFTFTCESDSASKMTWPGALDGTPTPVVNGHHPHGKAGGPYKSQPVATQGTQTTPSLRQGAPAAQQPRAPAPPAQQQPKPKPRPRRPSKEYALAARQRKLQQEYQNYHHRPTKDNMWICEFCEYEDIFGQPPAAMIRRYEIKDRQERKKAAEKRRLLEKAKMKNRKGKKGKGGKNNAATAPPPAPAAGGQPYDSNLPPGEEEYYDDEYDDGYEPAEGSYPDEYGYAPPAPAPTPAAGPPGKPPALVPPT